jgi:speckle-type POZ protein
MSPTATASTIVAETSSGYHHLKIDGYASLKGLPVGERLSSCPFTVGGHRWRINYYPNGDCPESAGHVSIYLVLDEDVAKEVTALALLPRQEGQASAADNNCAQLP